jgi:phenylpyruvate tautomerase PptA (4-oxalocrotonate tautomerase family)
VSIAISESMDVPIDRVRVIVQEVDPQLWGVAGVPLSRSL